MTPCVRFATKAMQRYKKSTPYPNNFIKFRFQNGQGDANIGRARLCRALLYIMVSFKKRIYLRLCELFNDYLTDHVGCLNNIYTLRDGNYSLCF